MEFLKSPLIVYTLAMCVGCAALASRSAPLVGPSLPLAMLLAAAMAVLAVLYGLAVGPGATADERRDDVPRAPRSTRALAVAVAAGLLSAALTAALEDRRRAADAPLAQALGEERVEAELTGEVVGGPWRGARGWSVELALERLDRRAFEDHHPRVRAYLSDEELSVGEESVVPLPGDRVRIFARIERFAPVDFPRRRSLRELMAGRGYAAAAMARDEVEYLERAPRWRPDRALARSRVAFERHVLEVLDRDEAGKVLSLVVGDRAMLDPDWRASFDATGTSHMLAISGLHLGLIGGLLWLLVGAIVGRIPRLLERWSLRAICGPVVGASLWIYVMWIGAPVSARRALGVALLAIWATMRMRQACGIHAVAAAACALLWMQPSAISELGFQLSFAATLGILLFLRYRPPQLEAGRDWRGPPSRRARWARQAGVAVGVSLAASMATWPPLLAAFGTVSVVGLPINVVAVPIFATLVFPAILLGAALCCVWPAGGAAVLRAGLWGLDAMQQIFAFCAGLPGDAWTPGAPSFGALALLSLAVACLLVSRLRARRLALGAVLLAGALALCEVTAPAPPPGVTRIHFVPIGQGDATLLELPDGSTMLIDAAGRRYGRDPGRYVLVPYLERLGYTRLDVALLTHADLDHAGGLAAVARLTPPRVFVYDRLDTTEMLAGVREEMREAGAIDVALDRPWVWRVGEGEATVRVVRAPPGVATSKNDASLIVELEVGGVRAVFPGDIERASEAWYAGEAGGPATILKVAHHGSNTSSTPALLDALGPRLAVVSAGRHNHFRHPRPEVVERYRRRGIALWRTDLHGLVVMDIHPDGRIEVRRARRP